MKKLLVTAFICLLLVSCTAVKDDMPVQILASELGEEINGFKNLAEASTDYIKYCMNSDLGLYSEYIVLYPFSGTTYSEIGIFKIKNLKEIDKGVDEINGYLKFKKDNWDTRYLGDEFKKIENAKVTTFGKYILYTVLTEDESNKVIKEFKDELM